MDDITFSIFNHGQPAYSVLKGVLAQFEKDENVRVRLEIIPWGLGWQRLMEVALYHFGPGVSEMGNTWTADFVRMDALAAQAGREGRSGVDAVATSWTVDPHVIFYRRDLLEKAGIDDAGAFATPEAFEATLARLQAAGEAVPLAIATKTSRVTVHNMASWVWGAGGDFLSADGASVTIDQPAAMSGMAAYFRLGRFLGNEARQLEDYESDSLFWQGKAAVTISGYWMLGMPPELLEKMGVARVPGVPFVGGQNLVVWKHVRNREVADNLVKFLAESDAALALFPHFGLPARESGWQQPQFESNPMYKVLYDSWKSGRSFSNSPLWGLVEKRLVDVVSTVWAEVFKSPNKPIEAILEANFANLASRLGLPKV